jgi:4-hydroxybenzoate polyprenyltransferase
MRKKAKAVIRCLRAHQWVKNLIIFVPLLTAHEMGNASLMVSAIKALIAFSMGASGIYVVNDLIDLESDRRHPEKRRRPFASGELSAHLGIVLAAFLLAGGMAVAVGTSWNLAMVLLVYFVLGTAYSLMARKMVLIDVFFLAGFYTLRLFAGQAATGVVCSLWLLVFAMFIFLSLALAKRHTELQLPESADRQKSGRGYVPDDKEAISAMGIGAGYMASLVLALYTQSHEVHSLYQHPERLLLLCPLLLFWISRIWLLTHRRQMHHDPVWFAFKDGVSYIISVLALAVIWVSI